MGKESAGTRERERGGWEGGEGGREGRTRKVCTPTRGGVLITRPELAGWFYDYAGSRSSRTAYFLL